MIRFKFGLPDIAEQNLNLYLAAVLERPVAATAAATGLARLMDELAADGVAAYRAVVRENPQFVEYFRQSTRSRSSAACRWAAVRPSAVPVGSRACGRSRGSSAGPRRA
jgi:phosphoenolpyruvate carboxylase